MNSHCVKPGDKLKLDEIDPNDEGKWAGKKEEGKAELMQLRQKLDSLQEILYAQHQHKVLVVLQGMDTSGKDGTIRNIFNGINPQGVRIASFKVPTAQESDHDFLWRIHAQTPGKGELVVFNRSHYEDVLVVRVHNLVSEEIWSQRYDQINRFERMLSEEGTTILKFYLHIDKDEQKKRLQDRLQDPSKHWKFNPADLKERELWPAYLKAYEDAISKTSTKLAPWYVIPANHNWYRNLCVAQVLVQALKDLKLEYPRSAVDVAAFEKELA